MDQDFKDLLSSFLAAEVEFLVVGAHALALQGHIRATKDLDVWIRPSLENARRVFRALADFGAPLEGTRPEEFAEPGLVFQIGVEPIRIDVINSIEGIGFDEAWPERAEGQFFGLSVPALGREGLLRNKRAAGRPQDLADVDWLERHPRS
jgi:hypothetical protein